MQIIIYTKASNFLCTLIRRSKALTREYAMRCVHLLLALSKPICYGRPAEWELCKCVASLVKCIHFLLHIAGQIRAPGQHRPRGEMMNEVVHARGSLQTTTTAQLGRHVICLFTLPNHSYHNLLNINSTIYIWARSKDCDQSRIFKVRPFFLEYFHTKQISLTSFSKQ